MTAIRGIAIPALRIGIIRSIFCVIIFILNCNIYSQTSRSGNSLIFSESSSVLELKKSNNRVNLLQIERSVEKYLSLIKNGDMHIAIVSYIPESLTSNLSSLNQASLKGSVIRAHFKIKYKLENFNFSFYINNLTYIENTVEVEVKHGSPSLHNNDIYYTTSNLSSAITAAMERYGEIPFLTQSSYTIISGISSAKKTENQLADIGKPRITASQKSSRFKMPVPSLSFYSAKVLNRPAITTGEAKIKLESLRFKTDIKNVAVQPVVKHVKDEIIKSQRKYYLPFFSIKSNLVYWYGLTPNLTKCDFIPNIEGEIFYSGRFSTSLEGFFTPYETVPESAQDWFKESGLIAEQKIWFGKTKRYNTLYLGLVGTYGDYDKRNTSVNELGYTGEYYGAGLSIGFLIPVYKGICFEIGLRGIYKLDKWESYKVRNGAFYIEESGTDSGIDLSGIKFSIQYRIGKSKSY